MSSAYNTEPPTRGKVVLRTTVGELEVELWPKEAPKACRNFVQLCLEGYYDGVIFHRVVRDFIVQSGDPTGTGLGGESVYGEPFADEFHSRLRFTHRGLLAMANTGPNSNTSQFFFTLNKTEELNRRNTIFGKIVGDTIFNMLKIGELDTDKDDRPLNPPKILGANVLSNPFDDILPRSTAEERAHMRQLEQELLKAEEDARKPKVKKNLALLSFGEDAEEPAFVSKKKSKSLHDAVDDPRLSKQVAAELSKELSKDSNDDKRVKSLPAAQPAQAPAPAPLLKRKPADSNSDSDSDSDMDSEDSDDNHRRAPLRSTADASASKQSLSAEDQIRKLRNEIKAIGKPTDASQRDSGSAPSTSRSKSSSVPSVMDQRKAYLSSGKAVAGKRRTASGKPSDGTDVISQVQDFRQMLKQASSARSSGKHNGDEDAKHQQQGVVDDDEWECDLHFIKGCKSCRDTFGEDEKDDDDDGWMTATLKFSKEVGANVYAARVDDYSVIDPRQELKSSAGGSRDRDSGRGASRRDGDRSQRDNGRGSGRDGGSRGSSNRDGRDGRSGSGSGSRQYSDDPRKRSRY